jgi:hypothetical protein
LTYFILPYTVTLQIFRLCFDKHQRVLLHTNYYISILNESPIVKHKQKLIFPSSNNFPRRFASLVFSSRYFYTASVLDWMFQIPSYQHRTSPRKQRRSFPNFSSQSVTILIVPYALAIIYNFIGLVSTSPPSRTRTPLHLSLPSLCLLAFLQFPLKSQIPPHLYYTEENYVFPPTNDLQKNNFARLVADLHNLNSS